MTDLAPTPTLRERLGGRRALSWQGVVIGDSLIVLLATVLAAAAPGDRSPIQAAADVFAITMATAIIAAAYAGVAHLTFLRKRAVKPLPVAAAIGFHLSIGVLFLTGFAVGAQILNAPRFGGGIAFSVAVLLGGLAVCLPTSVLLDNSDRYQESRQHLMDELTELEKLRITEWSLRRALDEKLKAEEHDPVARHLQDRIAALDLSDKALLSTDSWWDLSLGHHQGAGQLDGSVGTQLSTPMDQLLTHQWGIRYPLVRWSQQVRGAITHGINRGITSAAVTSALSFLMMWLFVSTSVTTPQGIVIGLLGAMSIFFIYRSPWARTSVHSSWRAAGVAMLASAAWAGVIVAVRFRTEAFSLAELVSIAARCAVASFVSIALMSWVSSVLWARHTQLDAMETEVHRRAEESEAVLHSLSSILGQLAQHKPWSQSATITASAAGLQRANQGLDRRHVRRILEWTTSVIAQPLSSTPSSLSGRIEEVILPWTALADISVSCAPSDGDLDPINEALMGRIAAIVNDGVQRSCRVGDCAHIDITVTTAAPDSFTVTISDDGDPTMELAGLERLLADDSLQVTLDPRTPERGSMLVVSHSAP